MLGNIGMMENRMETTTGFRAGIRARHSFLHQQLAVAQQGRPAFGTCEKTQAGSL